MPLSALILFVFAVLASGGMLAFAFRMRVRFDFPCLDFYFYFVITTVCYGLVNWIGPLFLLRFSQLAPELDLTPAIVVIVAAGLPLVLAKLFFLITLLYSILQRATPRSVRLSFMALSALVLLGGAFLVVNDLHRGSLDMTRPVLMIFGIVIFVAGFLAISHFLTQSPKLAEPRQQRSASLFGWSYLIGYLAYSLPFYLSYWMDEPKLMGVVPYCYYLMHFAPMFFLRDYCASQPSSPESESQAVADLDDVAARFGISARERSVLELVLQGKNNREIADHLFISPHTVRNHIYSIYGKMSVKNRVQLMAACEGTRFQRGETS